MVLCMLPYILHVSFCVFFHLLKLSGVARVLVADLMANPITPLGTPYIMLCQVTLDCSLIRRLIKSPCMTKRFTLSFHLFRYSSCTSFLVASLGWGSCLLRVSSRLLKFSDVGIMQSSSTRSKMFWHCTIVEDFPTHCDSLFS